MYLTVLDKETAEPHRLNSKNHYKRDTADEEGLMYYTAFFRFVKNDFGKKDAYCIGRLPIRENIGEPFYKDKATQELFAHYKPRVISREEYLEIVNCMREFIVEYYRTLLSHDNKLMWQRMIEDKIDTWEAEFILPCDDDPNSKRIVNSFDAEYQIFDMIRMLKTIDWEKDIVLFWGW